jgi:hypothetical protein
MSFEPLKEIAPNSTHKLKEFTEGEPFEQGMKSAERWITQEVLQSQSNDSGSLRIDTLEGTRQAGTEFARKIQSK